MYGVRNDNWICLYFASTNWTFFFIDPAVVFGIKFMEIYTNFFIIIIKTS